MKTVSSSEFKKHFGRYKSAIKRGQFFIITLRGKPAAKITPLKAATSPCSGLH
jgi:antitoxin (DNA-binding transcriptional repressor) of toxin-antitoxin stability system